MADAEGFLSHFAVAARNHVAFFCKFLVEFFDVFALGVLYAADGYGFVSWFREHGKVFLCPLLSVVLPCLCGVGKLCRRFLQARGPCVCLVRRVVGCLV